MLGKFITIYSLTGAALGACLIVIPAWACWCELYAIGKFPYAKVDGKGKVWHDTTVFPIDLLKGAAPPLAVTTAFALAGYPIVWTAMFMCVGSGIVFSHIMNSKLGGQTGDTYGATVGDVRAVQPFSASVFT